MIDIIATLSVSSCLSLPCLGRSMLIEQQLEKLPAKANVLSLTNAAATVGPNEYCPNAFELTHELTRHYRQSQGDGEALSQAAELFYRVLRAVQTVQDDKAKSFALSAVATAAAKLSDPNWTAEILSLALQSAQTIQNEGFKSFALNAIDTAYAKLNEPGRATEILALAIQAAQTSQHDWNKSFALRDIANIIVELNN